ncbi:SurA N-terminal domain-containing protein [Candidatus Saccharibacteria bacterium]|nr:SurA N-terminal domain-containing protein [Candidatus Saccharibacteria bacterium]
MSSISNKNQDTQPTDKPKKLKLNLGKIKLRPTKFLHQKDEKKTEQQKVDERREEVLSNGRKFKYPLQWTRHRVVVNTVMITMVVAAILFASGWLALYQFGMTDEMLYRITKIVPVPVATVDGENVLFSDYLMFYRSSVASIERQANQSNTETDLDAQRLQYKRTALSESEEYAYALKLAKENDIEVSDSEIAAELERHRSIGGVERSLDSFMKIVEENFDLSPSEYERMLYLTLMRAKVEAAIDTQANRLSNQVETALIENGGDYAAVATSLGADVQYEETGGLVSNQNIDGGRASAAFKLEPGQESGRFVSMNGDGYYFVKLIKKTDTEVNFVSIKVPFTEFDAKMAELRESGRIREYVNITDYE